RGLRARRDADRGRRRADALIGVRALGLDRRALTPGGQEPPPPNEYRNATPTSRGRPIVRPSAERSGMPMPPAAVGFTKSQKPPPKRVAYVPYVSSVRLFAKSVSDQRPSGLP